MRVDDAGPRTWLLAAGAGWALLAWLLALAGMGGRLPAVEHDPSLLKPLPPVRAMTASRIGPLNQYSELGARPLFAADRRPKPFFLPGSGTQDTAATFDYVLTSVMITPGLQMAILQPPDGSTSLRVKLGEAPEPQPAWRLSAVNARSAVFDGPEGQRTLELRVYNGQGGQAPTATSTGARSVAAPEKPGAVTAPETSPGSDAAPAPTPPKPATTAAKPGAQKPAEPMTEQAQMEAIRKRIQARREQLRQQSQSTQPPANGQ